MATKVSQRFGTKGSSVLVQANGYVTFYVPAAGTYVLVESGNGTDKRTITVGGTIVTGIEIENGVPVLVTQEV